MYLGDGLLDVRLLGRGFAWLDNGKVEKPADVAYEYWEITESQKTVKTRVKNVHKGDQLKIKIGKKTYTKKMTGDFRDKTFKIKVKKAKVGTKMSVWIVNKYGHHDSYLYFNTKGRVTGWQIFG